MSILDEYKKCTVIVRKPGVHKEDCCWQCQSAYEAERMVKFLRPLLNYDIIAIPNDSWEELDDYPNG